MCDWRRTLLVGVFVLCGNASAAELTLQSGPQQTVMIELYTSEGCSSCPPAEHFLNRLVKNKRLWKTYVPLAFHVDYWDYLGWRDRFASAANSQRQRHYARIHAAPTVYTPEFFVNGREWRRGFFNSLPASNTASVGILKLSLHKQQLDAQFIPQGTVDSPLVLHVARLGMQLNSQIKAGENTGRDLRHEFVVLQHIRLAGKQLHWSVKLPALPMSVSRQALVAWVSRANDPRPLQAVGGYITRQ